MHFKNFKNKLCLLLLLLTIYMIPFSVYAYSNKVIPGGENIGIELNSKGVLIVGFYNIGSNSPGKDAGLKIGDVITKVDDTAIDRIADLSKVTKDKTNLKITYTRNKKTYTTNLALIKDKDNTLKTGLYVKDSIIGIGTLTFIDPNSKMYGALGHEILEKSTGQKFEIKDGKIYNSTVTSIDKSTRNSPGEKNAKYSSNDVYGNIRKNEINGIYGKYTKDIKDKNTLEVGQPNEIKEGKATIRTVINTNNVEEFSIDIEKIFMNNSTKNILFKITDQKLLEKTNGIVQGMSGSPIIQNNKIVGAVTHVVVENPIKGYGIFITNMLEEADR